MMYYVFLSPHGIMMAKDLYFTTVVSSFFLFDTGLISEVTERILDT